MHEWLLVLWSKTSIDPLAFVISGIALWLAWKAYRNSTRHRVRLINLRSSFVDYGQDVPGPVLEATVLGCGLPIHRMRVIFQYKEKQFGTVSLAMFQGDRRIGGKVEAIDANTSFEPGMRGKYVFEWRSQHGGTGFSQMQGENFFDARKQRAAIVIESNGFEVQRFKLWGWGDVIRRPFMACLVWFVRRFERVLPHRSWLWEAGLIGTNYRWQAENFGRMVREAVSECRIQAEKDATSS